MTDTAAFPTLAGFDPLSEDFLRDPYPWFERARNECPVFYYEPLDLWVVTTHDALVEVVGDFRTYSSRALRVTPPPPELAHRLPANLLDQVFVNLDPPTHTVSRKNSNKAFTRGRVADLEQPMRDIADELIDGFAGRGECDLMQEFCYPLALKVIIQLLGVPEEDAQRFRAWTEDMFAVMGPGHADAESDEAAAKPMEEGERRERYERLADAHDYYRAFVADRRANPREDLISALTQVKGEDGEPALSEDRIIAHLTEFVAAGNDTTANLMGHAVMFLDRDPAQLEAVRAEPALMENVVEESLRMRGTSAGLFRVTTREVSLTGTSLPAGALMWLVFPSAGVDPAVFDDPTAFDVHRPNSAKHLAFGRGRHMCMGAPLARLEARIGLETLYARLPGLRVVPDQELHYQPNLTVVTLDHLMVEWVSDQPVR